MTGAVLDRSFAPSARMYRHFAAATAKQRGSAAMSPPSDCPTTLIQASRPRVYRNEHVLEEERQISDGRIRKYVR
jgi:hypothetical protein